MWTYDTISRILATLMLISFLFNLPAATLLYAQVDQAEKLILYMGERAEGAHQVSAINPDNGKTLDFRPGYTTNLIYPPLISPGGALMVTAAAGYSDIKVIDLAGNVVKTFDPPGETAIPRSWSAKTQEILFSVFTVADTFDLYKLNFLSGKFTRLTSDSQKNLFATWSPDGSRIAYMADYQLWVMQADGSGQKQLITQAARNLAWSPDGNYIAFESSPSGDYRDFDIWLVGVDGAELRNLSATPNRVDATPVWSPDGQQLAYTSSTTDGTGQVYLFTLATGKTRQLTQKAASYSIAAWLAADNVPATTTSQPAQGNSSLRKLAFVRNANLYTIYEDGSGLTKLTEQQEAEMQNVPYAWAEDGKHIAYLLQGELYLINVETLAQRQLSSGLDAYLLDWHDSLVALLRQTSAPLSPKVTWRLSYVDLAAEQWTLTDLSSDINVPPMEIAADPKLHWSPDGQWLALSYGPVGGVLSMSGNIVTKEIGAHPTWQHQSARLVHLGQTWLSAGTSGAATDQLGIWSFDPLAKQNSRLFPIQAYYVAYSPDDRYLVYADPYLKRMTSSGSDLMLLAEDRALSPTWSPSGDALAYIRWQPGEGRWPIPDGLFIINADGAARRQLAAGLTQYPTWQPQPGATTLSFQPVILDQAESSSAKSVVIAGAATVNTDQSVAAATEHVVPPTTGYVTAEKLNVRAEPSTQATILQQFGQGRAVTILGKSSDGQWLQVALTQGKQGWVAAQYVSFTADADDLAAAATPFPSDSCAILPDPNLQQLWQPEQLGCATQAATLTWAAWQPFEHGFMIWRQDQKIIYHFTDRQVWQPWPDRWTGTPPTNARGTPPRGLQAPVSDFGAIWEQEDSVFAALGWAQDKEQGFCLLVQSFENGLLLKTIRDNSCASGLYNHGQAPGFSFQFARLMKAGTWNASTR